MSNRPANDPILPMKPQTEYEKSLNLRLKDIFRVLCVRINGLADGQINAIDNTATTVPTTGTFQRGDFIRNSAPSELGAVSSKYVVFGWQCVTAGTPGTFVSMRFLTGN